MKRILIIISLMLLCGCSNNDVKLDLNKIKLNVENLMFENELMFKNNEYYTKEKLEDKYGIDSSYIDECLIYVPTLIEKSNMYIIVYSKNNKSELKKQMDILFEAIESSWGNGYAPLEEAKVKNKKVIEEGNYLIYIISDDNDLVYKKMKE